jgi:hypothetical protein
MIKPIRVLDMLGRHPATKKQARHLLMLFLDSKLDWILDFTGVEDLTPVFQEEFFGSLADQFGADIFKRRLTWVHLGSEQQRALHSLIQIRLLKNKTSRSS